MSSVLRNFILSLMIVILSGSMGADSWLQPSACLAADSAPVFVRLTTEAGEMLGVFYPELAPHHVAGFIHLSQSGFYSGTRFHRIVPGFVIQGGDPKSKDMDPRNDGTGGPKLTDVLNEEDAQLLDQVNEMLAGKGYVGLDGDALLKAELSKTVKHYRGTLSMARGGDLDTAGSQFFVCVADAPALDGKYTIFGHVFKGMDVADIIVSGEKNPAAGRDAPAIPVSILKMEIIEGADNLTSDEKNLWEELPAQFRSAK